MEGRKLSFISFTLIFWIGLHGISQSGSDTLLLDLSGNNSFEIGEGNYTKGRFELAIAYYKQAHLLQYPDSVVLFEKISKCYGILGQKEQATEYLRKYIKSNFDVSILESSEFETIRDSKNFKSIEKSYRPNLSVFALVYFNIGLIGFFLFLLLNVRKTKDILAQRLISFYVLLHSIFIVQICMYITNYRFSFPHILFASASFSFLYGPLVYFYFKRVTRGHRFKWIDGLHLLPCLLYILKNSHLYLSSGQQKLMFMLNFKGVKILDWVILAKIISLILYGLFVYLLFRENKDSQKEAQAGRENIKWQKFFMTFYILYIIGYVFYIISVTLGSISPLVPIHTWISFMSLSVLLVGYFGYAQPKVFAGTITVKDAILFKYSKSGLTESFSKELKQQLEILMTKEKVYREHNLDLEALSNKLGTNRHNTSQVINEHFGMNYFDFINHYRIEEAKQMLLEYSSSGWKWEILDILYHVGFNNRMTFNKAFKKYTSSTPSAFRKTSQLKPLG
ncbi:helix-turn-helix domain-containing protein [Flagellimonas allohymeniacidonis]|uniref:Helix-turn-helix domain-containing protein n=1 Tax=Flagellimonas allohymeniacidonis TaxID=2517819 RepID=A0A4Q8QDP0_9FLAO|nr:AraC family transcriptional regulator [Allomuricauda hymeniacidonis]TAI48511.1 helix-turn-helix domain-containing protein [Allomuricauda hymeniacidonis]